jgi:hypothetical protein
MAEVEGMLGLGIFFIYSPFVTWGSARRSPLVGPLYQPQMIDEYGNVNRQVKVKYLGKPCPSATSSTTDPT